MTLVENYAGMKKGSCLLYKAGCETDGNSNLQYYAMTDCAKASNYSLYVID